MQERRLVATRQEAKGFADDSITAVVRPVTRVLSIGAVTEFGRSSTPGFDWMFRDKRMCWNDLDHDELMVRCPLGVPGDRLWVAEAYCKGEYYTEEGELWYRARAEDVESYNEGGGSACDTGWHPAITMPRKASHTLLEVVTVKALRAHELTEEELEGVGVEPGGPEGELLYRRPFLDDHDPREYVWYAEVKRVRLVCDGQEIGGVR